MRITPERLATILGTTESIILILVAEKHIAVDYTAQDDEELFLICPSIEDAEWLSEYVKLLELRYLHV